MTKVSFFRIYGDRLLFVLALIILAAVLFRQGGKKAITMAAAPSIVFTHWWEEDLGKETLPDLVAEFESRHEGIKVILDPRTYEELREDLFNPPAAPAGESARPPEEVRYPGDVLALDPLWVYELTRREIIDSRPEARRDEGALILSFIDVLYYNIDILKEAGFSRPPKTRDEFIGCLRAVAKNKSPAPGLAVDFGSSRLLYDDILPWIWAGGTQLVKDGKPAFNTGAVTGALSFLNALSNETLLVSGGGSKMENFVSGGAAFMIAPSGAVKHLRERMGDERFGVTSVPVPGNYPGRSFYGAAGWTIGINKTSELREEAGLFAAFLEEKAALLSGKAGAVSGDAPEYGPDPFYSKIWDITIAGESARDFPGPGAEEIITEELRALFAGEATPAETAEVIQERWDALPAGSAGSYAQ